MCIFNINVYQLVLLIVCVLYMIVIILHSFTTILCGRDHLSFIHNLEQLQIKYQINAY